VDAEVVTAGERGTVRVRLWRQAHMDERFGANDDSS
jgi:hypothetical protein